MIQRIRRRFIRLAVIVLSVTMLTLAGVINLVNWVTVRAELRQTVENLFDSEAVSLTAQKKSKPRKQQNALDEARYFLIRVSSSGEISILGQYRTENSSEAEIRKIVSSALLTERSEGWAGNYLFGFRTDKKSRSIGVFLNCETKLDGVRTLLIVSASACAAGILMSWLAMLFLSSRAIRPMVRSAIQQKQFITDAGHELKTPLTVIAADMDALALQTGENEWIEDARRQVGNMRGLVSSLIWLSRMDEDDALLRKEPVDFSQMVRSQAESFQSMAEFLGKDLRLSVQDGQIVRGDPDILQKMVSQLLENAVHYAPEDDAIAVRLEKKHGSVVLTTENSIRAPLPEETLTHLFDRFYRPDASRSKDSGGYGLGLSMVRAAAEKHGGSAHAEQTPDGLIRFVCALPAESRS